MTSTRSLLLAIGLAVAVGGCSGSTSPPSGAPASPEPSTTPAVTPTPIAATVTSAADAAALVIATDPRFEGAIGLTPDVIGASKWWTARALADGAYQVTLTIGWGDCPSGCINQHTWRFRVAADGQVTLLDESGDPVSADGIPTGDTSSRSRRG